MSFKELTAPRVDFENVVHKTILAKGDIPDQYYLTGGSWQLRKYVEAGNYAVDLTSYLFPQYGGPTQGDRGHILKKARVLKQDKLILVALGDKERFSFTRQDIVKTMQLLEELAKTGYLTKARW